MKPVIGAIPPNGLSNDVVFNIISTKDEMKELYLDYNDGLWEESQGKRLALTDNKMVNENYPYALGRGNRKFLITCVPSEEFVYQRSQPCPEALLRRLETTMLPLNKGHLAYEQQRLCQIPEDQNRFSEASRVLYRMIAKALRVRQRLLHANKHHVVRDFRLKTETDVIYLQNMLELVGKHGIYSVLNDDGEIHPLAKSLVIDPGHLEARLDMAKSKRPPHLCRNLMIIFGFLLVALLCLILVFNGDDHFFDMSYLMEMIVNATRSADQE